MVMKTDAYTEGHARKNISPNTYQTDYGLEAVKTYGNAESRVQHKKYSWEAMDDNTEGCNQRGTSARNGQTLVLGLQRRKTMSMVMLREPKVPTHSGQTLV